MAYNRVNFITNGFGKSSSRYDEDFSVPGPMRPTMGTQFAQPFADPYRINGVGFDIGGVLGNIWSGTLNLIGTVGKVAAPLLPGVGAAVASKLLTKTPTQPTTSSGSSFTQSQLEEQAKLDAANAEKTNRTIYIIVGGVALVGLYLILNRRRRRK
ncbi:MAG: hypothetical protein EBU84_00715 [Actinobacteria bacterium]|nr:hypothetical protein [Actinomycetota bacterium]